MSTHNEDPQDPRLFSSQDEAPSGAAMADAARPSQADVRTLVDQMVAAGEWPAPALLEQILAAGDAAVEPLVDLLRAPPKKLSAVDSLSHAIGLLSDLRRPDTIPDLVKIVEQYDEEPCFDAACALIEFGPAGFEALLNLCSNPALSGYQQAFVLDAAVEAAGHDPARKSRLAEAGRPILDQAIAEAREELKLNGFLEKVPPDDDLDDEDEDFDGSDEADDDPIAGTLAGAEYDLEAESDEQLLAGEADDDEPLADEADFEDEDWDLLDDDDGALVEPLNAERVGIVAHALATIADPLARDTIIAAFEEGLIDESIVTREQVLDHYDGTIERPHAEADYRWFDAYREDFAAHNESLNPTAPMSSGPRSKYRYEDRYDEGDPPDDIPPTAPIRNGSPRLGRNDPCWCGSGKKYKKCHLGKDTPA
jgi:hypothetical protein